MIQGPQLFIVLAIVLLLFGGSKLPKLARSLGEAQKEFRHGLKDGESGAAATEAAPVANASSETTAPTGDAAASTDADKPAS